MPDIFVSPLPSKKESGPAEPVDSGVPISSSEVPKTEVEKRKIPGHTHNPLAAYCPYPDNVRFTTQDPEEKIVLLLRRHPITNVPWIVLALIMLFSPLVLSEFPLISFLPMRFQVIALLFWYLLATAFILEQFLNWFFNVFIITDERVIDVDFINLIYRELSDADIDKIQDVTVKVGGVTRALFNYGDILIQTAGEVPEIEFEAVPRPDAVATILRELRVEEEKEKLEGRIR